MNIETLNIPCAGYSIVADWYEGTSTDRIVLVLPGYSSSRARHRDLTSAIVQQTGTSALALDYSGHGDSPFELGETRPAQHFLEVICAFDWLKAHYPKATLSVMGSSYGGFLATQLTKYREFERLVLRVPAIYKPEAFYDLWAIRLANPEAYDAQSATYRSDEKALRKHPLFARASNFAGKTLVIVHSEDEFCPPETTNAFIRAFNADSFVAEGFSHRIAESINEDRVSKERLRAYQRKIADWLQP